MRHFLAVEPESGIEEQRIAGELPCGGSALVRYHGQSNSCGQ